MDVSRRKVLGIGAAVGLTAAFPGAALAQQEPYQFTLTDSRPPRRSPVMASDLSSRRRDFGVDISDYASPRIISSSGDVDLTDKLCPASQIKPLTLMVMHDIIRERGINWRTETINVSDMERGLNPRSVDLNYGNLRERWASIDEVTLYNAAEMIGVGSRNGMCNAVGRNLAGNYQAFVDRLNAKAHSIGMVNTFLINPSGLPASQDGMSGSSMFNNVSTVEDLIRMSVYFHKNYPDLAEITSHWNYAVPGHEYTDNPMLINRAPPTNPLFRDYTTGNQFARSRNVTGTKSGFTRRAGYSLISMAEPDEETRVLSITTGHGNGGRGRRSEIIINETIDTVRTGRFREMQSDCQATAALGEQSFMGCINERLNIS